MTKEKFNYYATKVINDFKVKYPSVTSADLQSFILGLQEGFKIATYSNVEKDFEKKSKVDTIKKTQ